MSRGEMLSLTTVELQGLGFPARRARGRVEFFCCLCPNGDYGGQPRGARCRWVPAGLPLWGPLPPPFADLVQKFPQTAARARLRAGGVSSEHLGLAERCGDAQSICKRAAIYGVCAELANYGSGVKVGAFPLVLYLQLLL